MSGLIILLAVSRIVIVVLTLAGRGRSVDPRWPRLMAHLQKSAGERLLSHRIWSTHLLQGRPGRRLHWLLGGRASDRMR